MNIKCLLFCLSVFFYSFLAGCQTKNDPNAEFVRQVTHLKEFKESEKRIDSIAAKEHMPFKIGLSIIDKFSSVGNAEHIPRDTSEAIISFNRSYDHIILFKVKFSKSSQKIVSIEKNRLGTSLKEYGWTDDTK